MGATQWLGELPALIDGLEHDWCIAVGRPYGDATEAFVAQATLGDGTPAVLKLVVPRAGDAARNEITVLRLADGGGWVRPLRDDAARGALLLERLGPPLHQLGLPVRQRQEILASTAARVWRPAPECTVPTGADKGRWLIAFVPSMWEELDRRCTERAVDHARACAGGSDPIGAPRVSRRSVANDGDDRRCASRGPRPSAQLRGAGQGQGEVPGRADRLRGVLP